MKEPYASAIYAALAPWASQFDLASDRTYEIVLTRSGCCLKFSCEPYYPTSVSSTLAAPDGKQFRLGTLEEILDPARASRDLAKLRSIGDAYRRDRQTMSAAQREQSAYDMMHALVQQGLTFFLDAEDKILDRASYEDAYEERDRAAVERPPSGRDVSGD